MAYGISFLLVKCLTHFDIIVVIDLGWLNFIMQKTIMKIVICQNWCTTFEKRISFFFKQIIPFAQYKIRCNSARAWSLIKLSLRYESRSGKKKSMSSYFLLNSFLRVFFRMEISPFNHTVCQHSYTYMSLLWYGPCFICIILLCVWVNIHYEGKKEESGGDENERYSRGES